jgi:hypothetical protein
MSFFSRSGWQVQFIEADLKTPLPRKFIFADPEEDQGIGQTRRSMGRFREPTNAGGCH